MATHPHKTCYSLPFPLFVVADFNDWLAIWSTNAALAARRAFIDLDWAAIHA